MLAAFFGFFEESGTSLQPLFVSFFVPYSLTLVCYELP